MVGLHPCVATGEIPLCGFTKVNEVGGVGVERYVPLAGLH